MLAILIICLVIFGAISLPIGIAMGLATMLCLVFATNIDPIMVAQNAFAGIDSFSLMAIPFFMLAGNFMRYGGISKRLLDLADNIVGFFTGGLGAITTFTAMFYAAISGSGPATVSAIGSFMIPEMEEKGYDKGYATALSAAPVPSASSFPRPSPSSSTAWPPAPPSAICSRPVSSPAC